MSRRTGVVLVALLIVTAVGWAALGDGKTVCVLRELPYRIYPGASGYVIVEIHNPGPCNLNKFGLAFSGKAVADSALAIGGPATEDISGNGYITVMLEGGLPQCSYLLVSVKLLDPDAEVLHIRGYKIDP